MQNISEMVLVEICFGLKTYYLLFFFNINFCSFIIIPLQNI